MKRDMDLIRKILFEIEGTLENSEEALKPYSNQIIGFHKHLIIEAGLAHGTSSMTSDSLPYPHGVTHHLTWEGYEFIDSVRDDTLWKKTKQKVIAGVSTASMELIKQTVGYLAKQAMGIL